MVTHGDKVLKDIAGAWQPWYRELPMGTSSASAPRSPVFREHPTTGLGLYEMKQLMC